MFDPSEVDDLIKKGWVDTPARLDLPEDMDTGFTEEQVKKMRPEDLKANLEGYGFIVLTQEQLKAEATKMANNAVNLAADELELAYLPDDIITEEFENRGLLLKALIEHELDVLEERFNEAQNSLNIEELLQLGNERYKLGLRDNMKPETLIKKIDKAIKSKGQ